MACPLPPTLPAQKSRRSLLPRHLRKASPAPYDDKLARLSEILGAVQYLRTLCPSTGPQEWRKAMGDILAADTANEPQRKQRMTAAFNRGYRTFAAVHTSCTPAALSAERNTVTKAQHSHKKSRPAFGN